MAFEQLSQQLDEVLAAGVPVDQESVLTLFVLSTRLQAVLAEAAAGFDKSVDWQASGARTCKGYLTRTTRLPAAEVGRCLRLGRELPAMSFVAEALQTGEISTAHARMIMGLRNSRTAGSFERAVFKPDNRVEVSKRARFFTGAIRRAIELRDRSCTHPYCDLPACKCECDHIVEYAKGGETTQENGRLLCGFHNRQRNQRRGPPDRPTASEYPPAGKARLDAEPQVVLDSGVGCDP